MTYGVDWRLAGAPADAGAAFQAGFDGATARRAAAEERAWQMAERERIARGRDASSAYLLSSENPSGPSGLPMPTRNALAGAASTSPQSSPAPDSLPSNALLAAATEGVRTSDQPAAQPSPTNALQPSSAAGQPSFDPAAAPQLSERDAAWIRWVKTDPDGAHTMRREEIEDNYRRLQTFERLNNFGLQLLAGVRDQASYDQARRQARELYVRYGEDTASVDGLPAQWTPQLSEQLRLQGMNTQDQLAGLLREQRDRWNIQDDQIDNEREQRNADSLARYREGRLRQGEDRLELTRTDPRRVAPQRGGSGRAPSPSSVIGAIMAKQARGEPLTPAEQQTLSEYRAPRGGGASRPGRAGGGDGAIIRNPATGQRMQLRAGQWVPI